MRSSPLWPRTCGNTIRRRRSTWPSRNRLRTRVRLPITRIGSPGSAFIAGTATATSSATSDVLLHDRGGFSDRENTTLGSLSICVDVGSSPPATLNSANAL